MPLRDDELAAYREGLESGTLRSASPAVVRQLLDEVKRLRRDRKEVESYLRAVAASAALHPEGYTIIDFQQVWLNQERDGKDRLSAEVKRLREALREAAEMSEHEQDRTLIYNHCIVAAEAGEEK